MPTGAILGPLCLRTMPYSQLRCLGDPRPVDRQALCLLANRGLWRQPAERRAARSARHGPLPVNKGAPVLRADAAAVEMALRQLHASAERLEQGHVLRLLSLLLLTRHVARTPRPAQEPPRSVIVLRHGAF